jgi:hypothetical protein
MQRNLPTLRRNWAQYHASKQQSPLPGAAQIGSPNLVESPPCGLGSVDFARPVSAGAAPNLPWGDSLLPPNLSQARQCAAVQAGYLDYTQKQAMWCYAACNAHPAYQLSPPKDAPGRADRPKPGPGNNGTWRMLET